MSAFDPTHPLAKFIREDGRYRFDAYVFVFESLSYAQKYLNKGGGPTVEDSDDDDSDDGDVETDEDDDELLGEIDPAADNDDEPERHVTGQELCESIRLYALDQFGYMAKCVLNSWGVHETGDFGEIVFNLIRIGKMKRSESDQREDFDNVYEFDKVFQQRFEITTPPDE